MFGPACRSDTEPDPTASITYTETNINMDADMEFVEIPIIDTDESLFSVIPKLSR